MKYKLGDLGPWLDIFNAEITVYHMWDESCVGLASHDAVTQTLKFSLPSGHPPGAFGVKKYVVWNVREGMKAPGQWYLDRAAGKVVYWPLPNEDMTNADAIAPTVESIFRLKGTKETPVRDVTLKGLTLSVTHTPLKAGGFGANAFDGAVSMAFARQCRASELTVFNVGGQGIKAWGCRGVRIENCETREVGACGMKVDGLDSVVTNNHVHHVGVLYPSAIGVWIHGERAEVSHNEIHDTPYTAIAGGGHDHRIERNLIYKAMEALHDGAGIYITFCKGVTLRQNIIRDIIETGGYGASAYYLDEQAENCLVEGNLSLRVNRPSHNHMAKSNVIRGNVFLVEGEAKLTFPRSSEFTLERNVICATGKIRIDNPHRLQLTIGLAPGLVCERDPRAADELTRLVTPHDAAFVRRDECHLAEVEAEI
ncbi:MAG: right-handed parallel beta-helix repeat-containing protein, partial [Armatimonadetes bacterium]|nr:right-handed parallel beta-helix repeat-containing protein [Armatimonadota bacterium]